MEQAPRDARFIGKSIMTGKIERDFFDSDDTNDRHNDWNIHHDEKAVILTTNHHEDENNEEEYMSLPESTHTLLITEKILSVPFGFAVGVACLSFSCLLLVLLNELSKGQKGNLLSVPGGVGPGVRGAQFCGIFVGILMEEEIGQGLILLRAISRGSFHHSHPNLSYKRFVFCCIMRILLGYLFLLNLFVTIVQADDVISIFFDVLALEFVQKLDDVAFDVAKKDLLGRTLNRATAVEYKVLKVEAWHELKTNVRTDEENDAVDFTTRRRGFRHLLKAVYFVNIVGLLIGVIIIGEKQKVGYYRCNSVTVNFGDSVWENAVILDENGQSNKTTTLVYSYFNGIYEMDGRFDGYPRFVERNKVDGSAYEDLIGAEIKYCKSEGAWIFTHEKIVKRGDASNDCSWLLRSPQTAEFDLVDVEQVNWYVWTGIIAKGNEVMITCNECQEEADCNYHGACINGKCECYKDEKYFGQHCEFEEPCEVLADDDDGFWNIAKDKDDGKTLMSYLRPMYEWQPTHDLLLQLILGIKVPLNWTSKDDTANNITGVQESEPTIYATNEGMTNATVDIISEDIMMYNDSIVAELASTEDYYATIVIIYSGSRWFVSIDLVENRTSSLHRTEYHAFWDQLFEKQTYYISDPAIGATPIGVDFYEVLFDVNYDDYGPFGLLKPAANLTGAGFFHCLGTERTSNNIKK